MPTIQERRDRHGRIRYTVQIRVKGSPHASATFPRLTEARAWAAETEAAIRSGRLLPGQEARRHTVADLARRYTAEVIPRRLSPKQQQIQGAFLRWWAREYGHLRLADLTPARIVEARSALAAGRGNAGARLKDSSINRYVCSLSAALRVACEQWQWISENPCHRVRLAPEPRPAPRFLSAEERDRLLNACRESPEPRLFPLVVLALATGARQSELLRMRWQDLDLAQGRAVIPQTKSGRPRTVPLVRRAVEALRAMPRRLGDDRVFAPVPGQYLYPRWAWEAARRAARLDGTGIRFHSLRHSCASWLALSGASLRDIQSILGHQSLAVTTRYVHLLEDHLSDVAGRMADRWLP